MVNEFKGLNAKTAKKQDSALYKSQKRESSAHTKTHTEDSSIQSKPACAQGASCDSSSAKTSNHTLEKKTYDDGLLDEALGVSEDFWPMIGKGIGDAATGVLKTGAHTLSTFGSAVGKNLEHTAQDIGKTAEQAKKGLDQAGRSLTEAVGQTLGAAGDSITGFAQGVLKNKVISDFLGKFDSSHH